MQAPNNAPACSRSRAILTIVTVAAAFAVAGCPATYQAKGFMTNGGYTDEALMNDRFLITFDGSPTSSIASVERFFHQRAEQLTKEKGYSSYEVENLRIGMQRYTYPMVGERPVATGVVRGYRTGGGEKAPSPGSRLSGSGFVVVRDGSVVTNEHVAGKCKEITARTASQGTLNATLIAADATNDLALIRLSGWRGEAVALGGNVRLGDSVVAFGYPLTNLLSSDGNLTTGTISALTGLRDDTRYLQTSAPIQPGNSGGPLFDRGGNVIGVNSSSISDARVVQATGGAVPQNVNFAIKADIVRLFLQRSGVTAGTGNGGRTLDVPDIADRAKRVTVQVICKN